MTETVGFIRTLQRAGDGGLSLIHIFEALIAQSKKAVPESVQNSGARMLHILEQSGICLLYTSYFLVLSTKNILSYLDSLCKRKF